VLQLASYGIERGIVKTMLEGAAAIVGQQYYGDVTIHPKVQIKDYRRILGHVSITEYKNWILAGERETWPKITMIRDQTIIGQTLEDCIVRLKKQRNRHSPGSGATDAAVPPRRAA